MNTVLKILPALQPKHIHGISVVIPVYQGEKSLPKLIQEIEGFVTVQYSPDGNAYHIQEVVLVDDASIDNSVDVLQDLQTKYSFVRTVWLSRNFGQHAATLAGIASTASEWVVTMDEDGQFNPDDIARLLDTAVMSHHHLVYAKSNNGLPHSFLRNTFSKLSKSIFSFSLGNKQFSHFSSFRLIKGEIARGTAAFSGDNVYLDGALSWVTNEPGICPVSLRRTPNHKSGYNYFKLFEHFKRLFLTSSKTPLRIVSGLGFFSVLMSVCMTVYVIQQKFSNNISVPGWTSLVIIISFFSGIILFSLGIIADYIGHLLRISMGSPLYLIVSTPTPRKRSS